MATRTDCTVNRVYESRPGKILIGLGKLLLFIPVKIVYGLRITGKEHLRSLRGTGIISVSNHCQYLEPVFTAFALMRRKVWFTAEENNITRKYLGRLNRIFGALGIPDSNPESIVAPVEAALRRKQVVHFYPEGKLFHRNQTIKPFKTGAFFIALKNRVPLLPLTEVLRPRRLGRLLPFVPPRVSFEIGKPIFPEEIIRRFPAGIGRPSEFARYVRRLMQNTIDRYRILDYGRHNS